MLVNQILDSLFNKKISNKICGAGATVFSVSAKGDIYPCFMLNDCEEYKLGNVYSLTDEFWDIQEGPMSKYYKYDSLNMISVMNVLTVQYVMDVW
ncbi:TPA: SPASM domain-containing protein [Streptococcus agalactiae]|nr:SPASM domain-containing protein [Peptoniphilus harei]